MTDWIAIFQSEAKDPYDGLAFARATRWQSRPIGEEDLFRGYGVPSKDDRCRHADDRDGQRNLRHKEC